MAYFHGSVVGIASSIDSAALNRDMPGFGNKELTETLTVGVFILSIMSKSLLTSFRIVSNCLCVWWAFRGPVMGEIWPKHCLNRKLVFLHVLHWGV